MLGVLVIKDGDDDFSDLYVDVEVEASSAIQISETQRPLPPAFGKKYMENRYIKKQTVVLKINSGVKWSTLKIKDKYYFMDGWLKFMKDNRLQMGVFLVFWLLSRSPNPIFQVFIYGLNGCLENPTSSDVAGASNGNVALVKEETSDDDSMENVQQKMTRVITKSSYHNGAVNRNQWLPQSATEER
ncbi:hypothetical protein L1987_18053 [Smallanthus sonchifolius]|uniref:Uncharacterized protein n=1 Tax=Smallanthus sonchifolius TaxID=185202 RepID=A0ACB9J0U6_9ASTR|nr:hypothetical protein L1987_18053 [Smallanthus sonchifolius]